MQRSSQLAPPSGFSECTPPSTIDLNLLSASGGYLADQLGWIPFFLITTVACLPGLGLLLWIMRRESASAR